MIPTWMKTVSSPRTSPLFRGTGQPTPSPVGITVSLYWSMLEAGLALIAACLPTLSYLFNKLSLSDVLNSLRSAFSLPSRLSHSQQSRSYDEFKKPPQSSDDSDRTFPSYSHIQTNSASLSPVSPVSAANPDAVELRRKRSAEKPLPALPDQIHVKKEIIQFEDIV
jgi:hypothetical protein